MTRFRINTLSLILFLVTLLVSASSIDLASAQQPSGGPVVVKCGYNASPPTITSGSTGVAQCDSTGHLITSGTISVGAVTVADGADTAEGTTTDTAWISGAGTTIAILKKIAGNTAGGGGGGPATLASGAVASGAYSAGALTVGAGVDGWNITAGAKADAAWVSGSGSEIALLKTIATNTAGGGGGNVNLTGINGTTPTTGTGNTAAGSLRTTVARDTTTIAGAAPGTAGTASTNVITVQGIAGGIAQPVSAASLPLPALASTSTKQSDGTQKTQIVDGSGNVIAATSNNLNVQCANCSGTGASATDGASFTAGSSVFAPSGVIYQTSPTANPLTNGKQGIIQGTANRAPFVNLRDSSGNEEGLVGQPLRTFDSTVNTTLATLAVTLPMTVVQAPYPYTPVAGAQYNLAIVASTALTVPATATQAKICAKTASVNYTTDGATTPTSLIGIPIDVGGVGCITLTGATVLANFRALSATGTLSVEYFN